MRMADVLQARLQGCRHPERRLAADIDAVFAKARASDDQALIVHVKLQIEKLSRDRYGQRPSASRRIS